MPDRGDDGSGAVGGGRSQPATRAPAPTPRSDPATDGSPPCFLSDISGWSLSLVRSPPAGRRRRFRLSDCGVGAEDGAGAVGGGRAQRATGSPCAPPRPRPHRDGTGAPARADRPARDRARDGAAAKPLITANSPTF